MEQKIIEKIKKIKNICTKTGLKKVKEDTILALAFQHDFNLQENTKNKNKKEPSQDNNVTERQKELLQQLNYPGNLDELNKQSARQLIKELIENKKMRG